MVLKRQCSFCAGEVEPGTGTMFVKRDGSVFWFCTSSCRKQQLHLGRVGHRLKWTRAHTIKRAAEQSSATGRAAARAAAQAKADAKAAAKTKTEAAPSPPAAKTSTESPVSPPATSESSAPAAADAPAKKPKTRKAKATPPASG